MHIPACFLFLFVAWGVGSAVRPGLAGAEQQGVATSEAALSAAEILEQRCSGCHAPKQAGGPLDAIAEQRKTPEGWSMTLSRMARTHGVELQAGEARTLVKYLSDRYGLAPAEVEPYRFILEQRNIRTSEDVPAPLRAGCVQCHTYARTALQYRTEDAWLRLADTKVALMANIGSETASAGLLRDYWYDDAKNNAFPHLAEHRPFETEAWTAWQARQKADYAGDWVVVGHDPGRGGDYTGTLRLDALGDDRYRGAFAYAFADGSQLTGTTIGTVYTGFQWRGVAQTDSDDGADAPQREIMFASEDGDMLVGRRLLTNFGDLGMDETWYRRTDRARLLAVSPRSVRTESTRTVRLFGTGFSETLLSDGGLTFGDGITVSSARLEDDTSIVAEVSVEAGAAEGMRKVGVEGATGQAQVAVYEAIDYVRVFPERGFARPGGIRTPKIFQQYEAIGYANGPDEKKGTDDDVRLGRVAPVRWNIEEYVKRPNDDDVRYVGSIDQNGLFLPNADGPNAARHLMEGNVGDVWIEAWYAPDGAKRPMGARAHLLVMPAKFIFPPIE